jgi:hypothetical protein
MPHDHTFINCFQYVGIKDNSILVFIGFSSDPVDRVFRMPSSGKDVRTERQRLAYLLPRWSCPPVTQVAARHAATEPPHREVTSPQAMAPCLSRLPFSRPHRGVGRIHSLVRSACPLGRKLARSDYSALGS